MAAIAVVVGTAVCTSVVAQSPAVSPIAIASIAAVAPVSVLTATAGQPAAMVPAARAAATPAGAVRTDDPALASAVFGLRQCIQAHELSELRITYNGAYGVSLLFAQSDLTYYVTLFQQRDLWHVIKTTNEASVKYLYSDFAKQI